MAYKCSSYGDFKNGRCDTCEDCGCQLAGLDLQIGVEQFGRYDQPPISGFKEFRQLSRLGNWYIQQDTSPSHCVCVFAEAAPQAVYMKLDIHGTNRIYNLNFDLSESSSIRLTHTVIDEFQGPFRRAHLTYVDFPSYVIGTPFQFFVSAIVIKYMLNRSPEFRDLYSSKLCPDIYGGEHFYVDNITNSVQIRMTDEYCEKNDKIYAERFNE